MQGAIEDYYGVERRAEVADFVRVGEAGTRESLLVRENEGNLELALRLPPWDPDCDSVPDLLSQSIEGVSHFVYLAERARTELPSTHLELELQAEIDKFVVWGLLPVTQTSSALRRVHRSLFEHVRFLHPAQSTEGRRYRIAHGLAARYVARMLSRAKLPQLRSRLRRFYRCGQTDKIQLALSA